VKYLHETHPFWVEANISYINLTALRKNGLLVSRFPFPRHGGSLVVSDERCLLLITAHIGWSLARKENKARNDSAGLLHYGST